MSKNRTDSWSVQQAAWYASQTNSRLESLKVYAWNACDLDGYAYARAEQYRRTFGGTLWDHVRLQWGN